jgi:transcriptional regulator GlxA family with amidase domain
VNVVRSSKRILIMAFPGVQLLDVVGPAETFAVAERFHPGSYRIEIVAPEETVVASSGLQLRADRLQSNLRVPVHTVLVPGGEGTVGAYTDPDYVAAMTRVCDRAERVVSVCSGAFLLARIGLLDGKRATTHWSECERLARLHPDVTVEPDAIYVRDDAVWTSAGVTAGIDLALAVIEHDLGRDAALEVARWLVVFVRRPGGQSQFSAQLGAQATEHHWLRDLQSFVADHPEADLSVGALAERSHVSARHLARVFTRELGCTPATYVERSRVDVARRLLEDTGLTLDAVADGAGFGSVETLRRAFRRVLGVAPHEYRARFRAA